MNEIKIIIFATKWRKQMNNNNKINIWLHTIENNITTIHNQKMKPNKKTILNINHVYMYFTVNCIYFSGN